MISKDTQLQAVVYFTETYKQLLELYNHLEDSVQDYSISARAAIVILNDLRHNDCIGSDSVLTMSVMGAAKLYVIRMDVKCPQIGISYSISMSN